MYQSIGHISDFETDVDAKLRRYNSITGVDLQQPDTVRSIFDPLLRWGQQSFNFRFLVV